MTPRQRMTEAVRRGSPDRVPMSIGFTPAVHELFTKMTGGADPFEFFDGCGGGVGINPTVHRGDFSGYLGDLPANASVGEYGNAEVPGEFYHFSRKVFPMADLHTAADVEAYPWPDVTADYRFDGLADRVRELHDRDLFASGGPGHIFESAWALTGMEKLLESMVLDTDFAAAVFDHITENNVRVAKEMALAGVDMLDTADDVAMQDRMIFGPEMWRKWLKPRHGKVIAAAREVNPDIAVFYHSDGAVDPIVEDLIEIGVTVLNPVQPECMDVHEVKRKYGDRLAVFGTIGTQTVMPFGSTLDVKRTVKEMIELFAPGLIVAPTHVLEPDVPWDNIVALRDAVREYGRLR